MASALADFGVSEEQIRAYFDVAPAPPTEQPLIAENRLAFDWFQDLVPECLNWQPLMESAGGMVQSRLMCTGLDLAQVAADMQLNPREYDKQDYQKVQRLGRYLAELLNRND